MGGSSREREDVPCEIGVRELLTTIPKTSSIGIVRRRRVGGVGFDDGLCAGAENNLPRQMIRLHTKK